MKLVKATHPLFCRLFLGSLLWMGWPTLFAQDILPLIQQCRYVKGKVASMTTTTVFYPLDGGSYQQKEVHTFDKKNRLLSVKTFGDSEQAINHTEYIYIRNRLICLQQTSTLGSRYYYYQYLQKYPVQILEVNEQKDLLSISKVYLDSLYRPTILKKYNLLEELQFSQIVEYVPESDKCYVQHQYPNEKSMTYEYQICANDLYLGTIDKVQFENIDTKILNFTIEDRQATIVKAVNKRNFGKEEIHVQELKFDKVGNWVKNTIYRLKKRKQKKILLQQTIRDITYR